MRCPYCGSETTKVVDKRDNYEDSSTRRRRECLECNKRFTTYERIEKVDISIEKKDGSLENFDREKLIKGIDKSVGSNISMEEINDFADDVERKILNSADIVSTKDIGLMVLNWLKSKDKLSYMRFASVYKDFKSLEDFKKELNNLTTS
jgi:transcriptional repressor NrdR